MSKAIRDSGTTTGLGQTVITDLLRRINRFFNIALL